MMAKEGIEFFLSVQGMDFIRFFVKKAIKKRDYRKI